MVWSFLLVVVVLSFKGQWQWLKPVLKNKKIMLTFITAGVLVGANWSIYIWAVNAGFIVETSLGYFINPLVSVMLGVIFFKERLRLWQGIAVGIAMTGVLYLTVNYGSLPWIALSLALTFGFYGLLKKTTRMNALHGLALEMTVVSLPALAYLVCQESLVGQGALGQSGWVTILLLMGTGVVTAFPLILYTNAVQRIPLSMMGLLFYMTPTMQFLIGVWVYGEPFTQARMIGFSLVWTALLLYSIEGVIVRRRSVAVQYAN